MDKLCSTNRCFRTCVSESFSHGQQNSPITSHFLPTNSRVLEGLAGYPTVMPTIVKTLFKSWCPVNSSRNNEKTQWSNSIFDIRISPSFFVIFATILRISSYIFCAVSFLFLLASFNRESRANLTDLSFFMAFTAGDTKHFSIVLSAFSN